MLKSLVWLHRWSGVALSLFFAMWFASGAILLFVPFPALDPGEAAARRAPIPLPLLRLAPAQVAGRAQALRLVGVDGSPVYVLTGSDGTLVARSGETGDRLPAIRPEAARRIAEAFGRARALRLTSPLRYDQWTVHQGFDAWRPFYRVRLDDRDRTDLYVSAVTGEVFQKTRGYERAWNWAGAVVHWLYFVPLRRYFMAWDQTVWWLSLAGVLTTILGVGLGIYRTIRKLNSKRPGWTPFKGWLGWHHLIGLAGGAVVLSWIVSGWLSMDHGRLFSRGLTPQQREAAFSARSLSSALTGVSTAQVRALGPASLVRFNVVAGRLVMSADRSRGSGRATATGPDSMAAPPALIREALAAAWPEDTVSAAIHTPRDDFYAKAEGLAEPTWTYHLAGRSPATVYVDAATGEIRAVVDASRAAYDWAYYALHSFNFPWLLGLPALRDAVVLILLALGGALSVTSLVVAVRRLRLVAST